MTSSPYMSLRLCCAPRCKRLPVLLMLMGRRGRRRSLDRNPWLHRLLSRIGASIGAPILINTSFNTHGKPILNSAREALALLQRRRISTLWSSRITCSPVPEMELIQVYSEPDTVPGTQIYRIPRSFAGPSCRSLSHTSQYLPESKI